MELRRYSAVASITLVGTIRIAWFVASGLLGDIIGTARYESDGNSRCAQDRHTIITHATMKIRISAVFSAEQARRILLSVWSSLRFLHTAQISQATGAKTTR